MSATACQFCGKSLSRLWLRRDGDFCSREHREQYRLRQGMNRVIEAGEVMRLERRKERPQLIAIQRPAADAGSARRRSMPDAPRLGGSPCDFLPTGPALITRLRPAHAGAVTSASYERCADNTARRMDCEPVEIRVRMEYRDFVPSPERFGPASLRGAGFDGLVREAAALAARRRPGFERPLAGDCGPAVAPAVRFALRGGAYRLATATPAVGKLQPFHVLERAVRRGANGGEFPSASPERGVPLPPARRRTGRPVQAPSAGFAAWSAARVFHAAPARRAFAACFRVAASPEVPRRAAVHSPAGLAAFADSFRALPAAVAQQGHADRRSPAAADFWSAIPVFFRIAVPAPDMLLRPAQCGMGLLDGLFTLPRLSGRTARRRGFTVPPPPRHPSYPAWAHALLEASRGFGAAPPAAIRPALSPAAGRGEARGYGALSVPLAAPGEVLPRLRPWGRLQGWGALPAPAAPMPSRMPAPTAVAASAPRAELTRFAGASPVLPLAELGILSLIGGGLDEPGGLIEDNFGSGLGRWVGALDDWRIDAAGVRPGSLALFGPSLGLRDYDLEFLAKVEQRGLSWVCRAADLNNYHLLTISLEGEGKTQTLALTRRAVVAGVAEAPVSIPVPVAVRSKAAFRVQTCVSGPQFTVSVEGQRVDGWTDSRSDSGGIGFLAGQEDRARLYWVKLSPRGTGFPGRRARPYSPAGAGRVYGVTTNEQHAN